MRNRSDAAPTRASVSQRSEALVPSFRVVTGTLAGTAEQRRVHPAGSSRGGQVLSLTALEGIAAGLAFTAADGEHDWEEGTRRRYTCLLDTDLYDAWLIAWSPSSSLELHDHGGSQGALVVAAGRLVETYTDLRWRHPIRTRIVSEGESITVPPSLVHEVSNPGPGEALSVHVYSPPLRSMTFFDPRPGTFLAPLATSHGDLVVLEEAAT